MNRLAYRTVVGYVSRRSLMTSTLRTPPHSVLSRSSASRMVPLLPHQRRTLFIQTQTTPNEDSLKFIPGTAVSPSGDTYEFMTPAEALKSPLATLLFDVEGVTSVYYGPDFVSVNKDPEAAWGDLKPEIYAILMQYFSSGKPLFKDPETATSSSTTILDSDSEVVAMIKELLETRVRPAIMEDGGDIEFQGFDEGSGIVKLTLKGSCRGCDSSTSTLKNGIERMLMHYVPEVQSVEQVTTPEEAVALDEFAKLEARLRGGAATVEI